MKFRVETITPARAQKMLDQTERLGLINRSVRQARVELLAHAIRAGQWQVTHQGIALGANGAVLDGQHRLRAIILADQEVDMIVARDVADETFAVVDTGTARTTGDSLKIAGYTRTNHLAAVVRGYIAYDEVIGLTESYEMHARRLTTADVLDFLSDPDRADTIIASLQSGAMVAHGLARYGLQTALGISLATMRFRPNELGDATIAEFHARLTDGVNLAADSPILALRRWYMSDTGYARVRPAVKRSVSVAVTLKAINDYALGRPRSHVHFRYGVEAFPAPLPKGSRKRDEQELERDEATADLVGT
jgi:hypothetical protein